MHKVQLLCCAGGLAALALASGGAVAQNAPNLNALVAACATLPTQSQRLECYQGVSRGTGSESAPPSYAPRTETAPAPATAASPDAPRAAPGAPPRAVASDFGASSLESANGHRENRGPKQLSARVASATDLGAGHWMIELEDGARWKTAFAVLDFLPPHPHDVVRIRSGAMGSYRMDVGAQGSIDVTRVR